MAEIQYKTNQDYLNPGLQCLQKPELRTRIYSDLLENMLINGGF